MADPDQAGIRRVVQWVNGAGGGVWVLAKIFASVRGSSRSGRPLRGRSPSEASPPATTRCFQRAMKASVTARRVPIVA